MWWDLMARKRVVDACVEEEEVERMAREWVGRNRIGGFARDVEERVREMEKMTAEEEHERCVNTES